MIIRRTNKPISLWNTNPFSDFFDDAFLKKNSSLMKTDIREDEDKYIFDIDLPGYNKEDIKISLEDGYLSIEAKLEEAKVEKNDKSEKEEFYLRRERRLVDLARTYYVGDVEEDKIEAKYLNGVLSINVLKQKEAKIEEKKFISIN